MLQLQQAYEVKEAIREYLHATSCKIPCCLGNNRRLIIIMFNIVGKYIIKV